MHLEAFTPFFAPDLHGISECEKRRSTRGFIVFDLSRKSRIHLGSIKCRSTCDGAWVGTDRQRMRALDLQNLKLLLGKRMEESNSNEG